MATFEKGILGGFSGKIGPVIGSTWKGKDVMRSRSGKRKGQSSVAQIDQQLKFSTAVQFLHPFTGLLDVTFKGYANGITALNSASSYTLKNAIGGKTPDYVIDYEKALISRGNLPNATAPAASVSGKSIFFTWVDNSGMGNAAATDTAVLLVYCKELNAAKYTWKGAPRSSSADSLDIAGYEGKTVQTYIGFLSADGREVSDSIYTGQLTIG